MPKKKNYNQLFRTIYIPVTIIFIIAYYSFSSLLTPAQITPFFSIFLIFYFITIISIYFVYKKISNYLSSIQDITNDILKSKNDGNISLPYILQQVETIVEKLTYNNKKLSKRTEGFNTIIESIGEIIWIQDKRGLIKLYNQSFCKITNCRKPKDQYFWNVMMKRELEQFVDEIHKNPCNKLSEIEFDNKCYLCSSSFVPLTNEIVFILHDVTELQQLKIMKRDFILNVSHELRTPLTSIKGFLETMEDDLSSENKYYIEVIKRNTDRLIHIVNDLLELTKIEHLQNLQLEKIDIVELISNTVTLFEASAKSKNLKIEFEHEENLPKISADYFKLEQVFINLIDNAIKYTDIGTIKIAVELKDQMIIQISDTGRGIPEKHIPRLFERFYVVDKSRSRKLGGTGLGLSIVKHIINLHEGEISVNSKIAEGTTFTVKLWVDKKYEK